MATDRNPFSDPFGGGDNGRTFVLRHAWCQTAPGLSDGEGDVPVTFGGMSVEEI
jgi:hypothetical protein